MCCICMVLPKSIFRTKDEKNGKMEKMFIVVYYLEKAATFMMMFSYTYVKYCDSVYPLHPSQSHPLFCNVPLLLFCVSSFIFLLHFTHVRQNRQQFSLWFWVFSFHSLSEVESNHVTEILSNTSRLLSIVLFYLLYPQSVMPRLTGLWALAQHPEYLWWSWNETLHLQDLL